MRLIDADAFYEKMNDLSKYHEGVYNGAINDCMNLLDNEPTAYDVEAVIAELEAREKSYCTASKKKSMEFPQKMYYTGIMRGYEYSREVVQNGGKE